ncbi:MAG: excinuclease [Pseudomonadota bacterium]
MHMKNWTIGALLLCTLPSVSQARDTTHYLPFEAVVAYTTQAGRLDGTVKFYLAGNKPAGDVSVINPSITTSHKTNGFDIHDELACSRALELALIELQNAAKAAGANAVTEIVSNYQNKEYRDPANYECHAGANLARVELKAQLATVE